MTAPTPPMPKSRIALLKRIEMKFKRIVFFPISLFLRDGNSQTPPSRSDVKRILLLRPETKIGDMVISLPFIKHLRRSCPNAKIYIFCSPRNVSVIDGDASLDGIFRYRKNIFRDILEVRRVRRLKCDLIIDLLYHDSLTTLILSQSCAPGAYRIGGGKKRFARYYDYSAPWSHDHIIDCTLSLMEPLGIDVSTASRQIPIAVSADCEKRATDALQTIRRTCPILIGMNVSAGTASRTWGDDNIQSLVRAILSGDSSVGIVILGTPAERRRFEPLAQQHKGRVVVPTNGNSIQDASAIIAGIDFVITPDTAMVHIARSLGKPVVGLYTGNMSNRLKFQPWGEGSVIITSNHGSNIHDITVDQVTPAVHDMLQKLKSAKVATV